MDDFEIIRAFFVNQEKWPEKEAEALNRIEEGYKEMEYAIQLEWG